MAKVKLRKRKSGKGYLNYEVTIPKQVVESLGWCDGLELTPKIITYEGKQCVVLIPVQNPEHVCKKEEQ